MELEQKKGRAKDRELEHLQQNRGDAIKDWPVELFDEKGVQTFLKWFSRSFRDYLLLLKIISGFYILNSNVETSINQMRAS